MNSTEAAHVDGRMGEGPPTVGGPKQIWARVRGRYQRAASSLRFRREVEMRGNAPCISFTFDDFPRSAVHRAGEIFAPFDIRATYYASFGLMGTEAPTGQIFVPGDVTALLAKGHELGCHTFAHSHAWDTSPAEFERSILRNEAARVEIAPQAAFGTFSYPISVPRPAAKRIAARHFFGCRCGGQTYNAGRMDVNLLSAFFIEKSRDDLPAIHALIEENAVNQGWLIFATHDISEQPTPYGCTPAVFEAVVKHAVASGARILPVSEALATIAKIPSGDPLRASR